MGVRFLTFFHCKIILAFQTLQLLHQYNEESIFDKRDNSCWKMLPMTTLILSISVKGLLSVFITLLNLYEHCLDMTYQCSYRPRRWCCRLEHHLSFGSLCVRIPASKNSSIAKRSAAPVSVTVPRRCPL